MAPLADADLDLIPNVIDNCPLVPNSDQTALFDRSQGQACDERAGHNPTGEIVPFEEYPIPPSLTADVDTVAGGETVELDVLANDPDEALDDTTLQIHTPPTQGQAMIVDDGDGPTISYTAPQNAAVEVFQYSDCDDNQRCAIATVTITVVSESECTITGTNGDDVIVGTPGDDIICALDGADIIDGGDGDDTIFGGRGADTIDGGDGDDIIHGRRGADELTGGRGGDEIHGGKGNDTVNGRNGADLLYGGDGNDIIRGGKGNDTGDGGPGTDTCRNIEHSTTCEG